MGKLNPEIVKALKRFKRRMRKYKLDKVILFGSGAKGLMRKESDLDIILVSRFFEGKPTIKRPLPFYLSWNLKYPVDFICYTPEEFERLRQRISIVKEAIEEGTEI